MEINFFANCRDIIFEKEPTNKCQQVKPIFEKWQNNLFPQLLPLPQVERILEPGRPDNPQLVPPLEQASFSDNELNHLMQLGSTTKI